MDFYISFAGNFSYKNAKNLHRAAADIPLDRVLFETDSPYLAPVPKRGKTNQPAYVKHVAECIAELRGVPVETIAEATTANFENLFRTA